MSLWVKSYGVTIQTKATEQYFPVVLFLCCIIFCTVESSRNAHPQWGGALLDDIKNGCVADQFSWRSVSLLCKAFTLYE